MKLVSVWRWRGGGLQPAPSGEGGAGGLPGSPMGCGSFSRAGCEGKLRQWGGGGPEGSRGVGRGTGPGGRLALLRFSAAVFPPPLATTGGCAGAGWVWGCG